MEEETWKPVVGYEGWYEVSNLGRVRRIRAKSGHTWSGRIIKPFPDGWGYLKVRLYAGKGGRTHSVHKLVAAAFIGPRPPGAEVNHVRGDKTDVRASQLEYLTPTENSMHAYRTGLRIPARGERNGNAVATESQIRKIDDMLRDGCSRRDAANATGVSVAIVNSVAQGKVWRHVTGRKPGTATTDHKAGDWPTWVCEAVGVMLTMDGRSR